MTENPRTPRTPRIHAGEHVLAHKVGHLAASTRQAAEHFGLGDETARVWERQVQDEADRPKVQTYDDDEEREFLASLERIDAGDFDPVDSYRGVVLEHGRTHFLTLEQRLALWAGMGKTITLPLGRRVTTTTRGGRTTEHRLEWLNANRGQHWGDSSPQVRSWRQAAADEAHRVGLPTGHEYVTIDAYIHKRARRMYDPANLAPTAKAIVDGLVEQHGLLPNDNLTYLDGPHLHHASFGADLDSITIVITPGTRPEHIAPPSERA